MSERRDADALAERLLSEPNVDPDDELRMLSRQLLRRREVIQRLEKDLAERYDGTLDLIHANRDLILKMHEEAVRRIKKLLHSEYGVPCSCGCKIALKVIDALDQFHPMHEWQGWPGGSK